MRMEEGAFTWVAWHTRECVMVVTKPTGSKERERCSIFLGGREKIGLGWMNEEMSEFLEREMRNIGS
jgi:hypothetical protein